MLGSLKVLNIGKKGIILEDNQRLVQYAISDRALTPGKRRLLPVTCSKSGKEQRFRTLDSSKLTRRQPAICVW